MGAGLEGIAIDLIEGKVAGLATFGVGGSKGLHAGNKRIQALSQGAAFGVNGSSGHFSKSSIRA
jgi:hypothetical protein